MSLTLLPPVSTILTLFSEVSKSPVLFSEVMTLPTLSSEVSILLTLFVVVLISLTLAQKAQVFLMEAMASMMHVIPLTGLVLGLHGVDAPTATPVVCFAPLATQR
jgi:hypothetical protein